MNELYKPINTDCLSMFSIEDLNEELKMLAELIGLSNVKLIIENYGGQTIYIPKFNVKQKEIKYSQIYAEYNGNNITELAQKYNLSVVRLYQIVKAQMKNHKRKE